MTAKYNIYLHLILEIWQIKLARFKGYIVAKNFAHFSSLNTYNHPLSHSPCRRTSGAGPTGQTALFSTSKYLQALSRVSRRKESNLRYARPRRARKEASCGCPKSRIQHNLRDHLQHLVHYNIEKAVHTRSLHTKPLYSQRHAKFKYIRKLLLGKSNADWKVTHYYKAHVFSQIG